MQIEFATIDDSESIAEVHVAAWQEAYANTFSREYLDSLSVTQRAEAWRALLADGKTQVLLARRHARVVGFVSFSASRDPDAQPHDGEVSAIYVLPSFWSTGVGLALWQGAKQNLRSQGFSRVTLWVITNNGRAIRFYTSVGFREEDGSAKQCECGGAWFQVVRYAYSL